MTGLPDDAPQAVKDLLRAGRAAEAVVAAEALFAKHPQDREACYLSAVALRLGGRFDRAEERLELLASRWPHFSMALQEHAHVARDRGDREAALALYLEAVGRNPTLRGAWNAISKLAAGQGDEATAARARSQLASITATPPLLLRARHSYAEYDYDSAEKLCREYLQQNRLDPDGMRLLAAIAVARQVYDDAAFLLETALELAPGPELRLEYAKVLFRKHDYAGTRREVQQLIDETADSPPALLLRAHLSAATGRYEQALVDYARVESSFAADPTFQVSFGHALKTLGKQEEAVERYRKAYALRPDFGDAYWSLANLKTYRFVAGEARAMETALRRGTTLEADRIHLHFALAKAREDAGDFTAAFEHYAEGNRLRKAACRYDAEEFHARLAGYRAFFNAELFTRFAGAGSESSAPIFIVGLPRSGSTLLEQIISSHSSVEGTKELPHIPGTVHSLSRQQPGGQPYPRCLEHLDGDSLRRLGEDYLAAAQLQRQTDAPHFIDKMPNNFRHVGLLQLMLPRAKIIDIRRHPLACCFSNFKQFFAEGQEFSYSLEDLASYYLDYAELMAHWDRVLPGRVLRVHYESLVEDLAGEVRRILAYCDLPFEDACLSYHQQRRAVRTASSEQVRKPIYRSGLDAWKPYEEALAPLRQLLQPAIASYPFASADG